ncbi:MAG TPA: type IV pilus biogenesis protein PilM [Noviherbaspirillum sp.]|jgi:hypothetical protein|uniref:type IV pilus biogenesis protein PilM n=1 Tax=Noviherbaspirillum sp. TaxID=1926288 RepID=UPI002F945AB8
MWSLLIVSVMAALAAFYMRGVEQPLEGLADRKAADLAESMAVYREAVIRYYTLNDLTNASVSLDDLKAANLLPAWSALKTQPGVIWRNYRDAAGTIYVYANTLPPVNIQSELAALSKNSHLVGAYKQAGGKLHSPVYGETTISLAALSTRGVPDNAPVWIGARQ